MMWKQGSCAGELQEGMEKAQLNSVTSEETKREELILEAMQKLQKAAENFENLGKVSRAKEVTDLMQKIAIDNEAGRSETSEVQKMFLFFGFNPEDLNG